MNDFAKEIEAMNKVGQMGMGTEPPDTDAPGTDSPSTDAPTTELPDEFQTNAPSTEVSSTDAPTTEVPNELAELRAELELLKSQQLKTTKAPSTKAPSTSVPTEDEDFIGDMDLDEIIRDPKEFNKLLNNIYKKGVESAKKINIDGSEGILKAIPEIVKSNIAIVSSLKKASEEFYNENEDLKPFKKVVAAVFEEVVAANPDKSYTENLKGVGDEVRKRLNLKKEAISKKKEAPKLPKSKGSRRQKSKPSTEGIASEIDAMNKSI